MPTKKSRILRFAVSTALIGAGPLAVTGACGGSEPHTNEPAPEPIHVNEPPDPEPDHVNEPAPDEPEDPDGPNGPNVNEPAPE